MKVGVATGSGTSAGHGGLPRRRRATTSSAYDGERGDGRRPRAGPAPAAEPGLAELIARGPGRGPASLHRRARPTLARRGASSGSPSTRRSTSDDRADVEAVVARVDRAVLPLVADGALVLISSQVPVGFTRAARGRSTAAAGAGRHVRLLAGEPAARQGDRRLHAARSAWSSGVRDRRDRDRVIAALLAPFTDRDRVDVASSRRR